jgi:hypothetical protein
MSTILTETPAATCEWCGKANTERLPQCSGCGTRLVSEPPPSLREKRKGKDRMTAVCLALIFGPLGLIYINAWGVLLVLLLIRGYFFATHSLNLWAAIAIRFASAGFAYGLFDKQSATKDTSSQAAELLDKAARLESVDRARAIEAYREVVRLYPNTSASGEATRNIKTLMRPA